MIALGLAGLAGFSIGCQDEKKPAPVADAGAADASTGPVVGGKLGEALAAAAAAPSVPDAAPDAGSGPPETGIFPAGAADAAQAPDAPPKIELFSDGSDPKVPLSYAFAGGDERKTTILLQVRAGQTGLAPLTVDLVYKADKRKDEKKADKAAESAPPPAGSPVVVKLAAVKALRGDLPEEMKNLKDGVIRYQLGPSGIVTNLVIEKPKEPTQQVELLMDALAEAVVAATVPLPDKPVGVGAYWMVTDRARSSGVDVVRYRVAKVEKVDGKQASLSLELRQYAANTTLGLPGLPKDTSISLGRYMAQGKGLLEVGQSRFSPDRGQITVAMQSILDTPGQPQQPGQKLVIQTELKAVLGEAP